MRGEERAWLKYTVESEQIPGSWQGCRQHVSLPTDGEDEQLRSFLIPTWTQRLPALPETN